MEVEPSREKISGSAQKTTRQRFAGAREEILVIWEKRVREQLSAARFENRSVLRDSLPDFLLDLEQALNVSFEEAKPDLIRVALKHGSQRASSLDYSIEDALEEFNILRKVIFEVLESKGPVAFRERDIILETINFGQLKAGLEYAKFQMRKEHESKLEAEKLSTKLQAVLTASEKQFRTMAESLPQLAWMANPDGWIFWFNQQMYDYTGATLEELEGWGWKSLLHPEFLHLVEEKYRTQFEKGEDWEDTFPLLGKNGEWRWFLSRARPIKDELGNITRWFGTNTDVTAQKIVEEEHEILRRHAEVSAHRLANLQALTEGLLSRTMSLHEVLNDVLVYVQKALDCNTVEIFLLTSDSKSLEVRASLGVGETLEKRSSFPKDNGVCGRIFTSGKAIKINNLSEMEVSSPTLKTNLRSLIGCPLRTPGGRIGVIHAGRTVGGNPFDDEDLVFIQLIADRLATAIDNANLYKIAENNVANLQKEQIIREKFVTTLSHDLRTPLTAAKMSAQLIVRKSKEVPAVENLAAKVTDSIDRVDQMITDLLDANRIQSGQVIQPTIELVDLVQIVKRSLDSLVEIHGDRFRLKAPKELNAQVCANGIRRVVENLCNNAVKYGHPKSAITVGIEDEGSNVSISVHNVGEALSASDRSRIFNQFERLSAGESSGKEGWGIGLAIVKGVAEAHGGKATVESVENGTIFRITLPKNARGGSVN